MTFEEEQVEHSTGIRYDRNDPLVVKVWAMLTEKRMMSYTLRNAIIQRSGRGGWGMKGSVVARGPGRWLLRFDMDRELDGKRRQYSTTFHGTKADAARKLRELITKYERGEIVAARPQTVSDYLDFWLENYASNLSERTAQNYREYVTYYIRPGLGKAALANLKPADIQAFYRRVRGRNGQPLSKTSMHHIHTVLRGALRQAVEWQLIDRNPADAVSAAAIETRDPVFLTEDQVVALLAAAWNTRYYIAVLLAVTMGMRRGEVAGLRWEDIDWERSMLSIRQARIRLTGGRVVTKSPKTKAGRRTISVPKFVLEDLATERDRQEAIRAECPTDGYNTENLVVVREDGRPYNPNSIYKGLQHVLEKAGLPHVSVHELRHTHASFLLAADVHIKVVADRFGHTTPAITLSLYSHVIQNLQTEAAEKVDQAFRRPITSGTIKEDENL